MKKSFYLLFLLLVWPVFTLSANGAARILDFHSDIMIASDGRIEVKESITIYADGYDIRRGIVRSYPVYRLDAQKRKQKMGMHIISVRRDGLSEGYRVETAGEYLEIYIGNSEVVLKPGNYTYEITYEAYGHVGFFEDHDELYWNVTGNDWAFPIEKTSATIRTPEGAPVLEANCYTGYAGDNRQSCKAEVGEGEVSFRATVPFQTKEGLTVSVSFPRDIIKRPPPPTKAELFWEKYGKILLAVVALLLIGIYYYFTWRKVGVDPEKPVVIPTFKPPHNWSPTDVRYLYKRKFDNKAFTVSLVEMAVKGVITIRHEKKKYTLVPLGRTEKLSEKEKKVYNTLFLSGKSITVSNKDYKTFSSASDRLKSSLSTQWNLKNYFLHNIQYIALAAVLVFILIAVYLSLADISISLGESIALFPFIVVGFVTMVSAVLQNRGFATVFLFLFGFLFAFPLLAMLFGELFLSDKITAIFLTSMILMFGSYVYLIKAPTELGTQTAAELEGFRMYLETAEEDRLNLLTPPERTPELFEQLLPYAIALNVENAWGKKFDTILSEANYNPDWYAGNQPFRAHGFINSFPSSFSNSVSNAQVNPNSGGSGGSSGSGGWSSGGGGGGFSGGGGGGGGGRGW